MSATLPIERRSLGRSELTIPRVALGCGNFGGVGSAPELFGQGLSQDQAFALMDAAWEQGIDHFDTADAYGGGRSERMIGPGCHAGGRGRRSRPRPSTRWTPGADHGLAPERIARQLESSLERLGVDHVDLYLAHEFDPDVRSPRRSARSTSSSRRAGSAPTGSATSTPPQLEAALAAGSPAVQNEHSLLARGDEDDVLPLCAAARVAYLVFSPLAGGWLTGKYRRGQPFPAGSRMTQRPEPYAAFVSEAHVRPARAARGLAAAGELDGRARARLAAGATSASPRSSSAPGGPSILAPVREALEQPLGKRRAGTLDSCSLSRC